MISDSRESIYTADSVDDVAYLEEFINPTLLPVLHDLAAEVLRRAALYPVVVLFKNTNRLLDHDTHEYICARSLTLRPSISAQLERNGTVVPGGPAQALVQPQVHFGGPGQFSLSKVSIRTALHF